MPFLFLALSVVYIFAPHVSVAFDYGPVGNNVFWVLLAAWSMLVAYILLQKRDALWRVIGSFAHALLTPGVYAPHVDSVVADILACRRTRISMSRTRKK
jgi:hypothetical protein